MMALRHGKWFMSRRARQARLLSTGLCFALLVTLLPAPVATAAPAVVPTLAFTTGPTTADPEVVFDVTPTVTVTDSTDPVTLSLQVEAGEPSGKLTCTALTVTPVDGVATFSGCAVDRGGRYRLRATLGAATVDSDVLRVSGPAYVVFGTQPTGGEAGEVWLGQPVAQVVDADGAVIATSTAKVGLAIKPGTGAAGAVLTCTETLNATLAVDGVATFSGCAMDRAGTGYELYAVDVDDRTYGTSAAFDVNAGPAAALRFDTQPGSGLAGQDLGTQPKVAVVDALGNRVAASTATVSLGLTSGTGDAAAVFGCTDNSVAASSGLASFAGCSIDKASAGYTLTASSPGLTTAVSTPLDVSVGQVSDVAFTTNPGGGPGGIAFAAQPVVTVTDSGGNPASGLVSLSIAAGTGATGAILTCDATTVPASAGKAAFSGCSIDLESSDPYVLVATLGALKRSSEPFNVTEGAPVSALFTTDPSNGSGGSTLATQPVVEIRDAGGNLAAGSVTLSLAPGYGTAGAKLTCEGGMTASAVNGVASFSGCRVDKAGPGYRLLATIDGVGVTRVSASFDIAVGDATHLAFRTQPGGGTGGTDWATQPVVAVLDDGGNLIADSPAEVNLAVGSGPGALECTADPLAVSSGAAYFAGCAIDRAAADYTLTASASGLRSATSQTFDIAVGDPAALVYTDQPSGGTAGRSLTGQPALAVVDAGGNKVPDAGGSVALAITGGTGTLGAALSCDSSAVGGQGTAAFGGCAVDQAGGGYALTATWKKLTAESLPFVVLRDTTPALEVAPTGTPIGQTIGGGSLGANPTTVVDDVNTATGALTRAFTDLEVAGVGQNLVLARTYNSDDDAVGAFGRGFSSILDLSVTFNASGTEATVRGTDGQRLLFTGHQGSFITTYTGAPGARADLVCTGNQKSCTVTQWDGTTWTVTGPRLDSYLDGNGLGLTFVRDSATKLRVRLATTNKKVSYDVAVTLNAAGQVTKVKTPAGRQTSYAYTGGKLTSFTDARGKTWTYGYDAGQRLTRITDPSAQVRLSVDYDAAGRVAAASSMGDVRHTQNRFTYDVAAQKTTREARTNVGGSLTWASYVDTYRDNVLVRQTFPSGAVLRYSYDSRLNLVAIQDPNGFVQERVFDGNGDLVTQSTPLDSTRSAVVQLTYDKYHRKISETDALGNLTTFGYTGANLTSVTPPGGKAATTSMVYSGSLLMEIDTPIGRQTFAYDAMGNVVRTNEFGPSGPALNGNGSRASFNEAGLKTSATDPRGVPASGALDPAFTTTWTYDDAGNLLSTRSPVGVVTTVVYDAAGDIVGRGSPSGSTTIAWNEATLTQTTTAPGGLVTTELYDPSGNLLATATPGGGRTTHDNDAMGRPVTITDPDGLRTAITYDAMSNAVLLDDGSGVVLRQQFDAMNRLVRQASGDRQTLVRFDLNGQQVRVQDLNGAVTERTYDARGHVASVTDAAGTTAYEYDNAGNPVKRTDGRGGVTAYTYDGMGRLTSQTVDGNRTTYAIDVAGQRTGRVDPEGRSTAFRLDGANRVTRTTHTQSGQADIVIDQTYDTLGRRASMTSGGVVSTYAYDARGNLVGAGPANQRFTYDFSTPGKILQTYPDGTDITYDVDDAGNLMRLEGQSADGHVEASYLRDANRRETAVSLANGVVGTWSYDADGRVAAQSVQRAGTVLAGETYTYDSLGRRVSQRTTAAGRSVLNAYAYDALGRVSGFSTASTTVAAPVVAPDTGGDTSTPPTGAPSVPVPASMDTGSKQPEGTPTDPATKPAGNITYDAVGNIVSLGDTAYTVGSGDRIGSQSGPDGPWTYDRSGAVTTMTGPKGTTTFGYDAAGRLTRATLQPPSGSATTVTYTYDGDGNRSSRTVGGTTTQYVWDPNAAVPQLALEKSGSTVQRRYFNDTVGPVAIQTPTETYYVHRDPLGSTNQLTDSKGDVVAAYSYTAFGEVTAVGPAAAASDLLFQGQQRDPVTGLYNMRARTYDPASGRFTQREPLSTPVGEPLVAAYAFVGNRPTAYGDPSGLMPESQSNWTNAGSFTVDNQTLVDSPVGTNTKFYLTTTKSASSDGVIGSYFNKTAIALKVGMKVGAKFAAAGATQTAAQVAKEASRAKWLKPAGLGLSILAIGIQTYVAVENCTHGTVAQCVGSSVGLAVNVGFTVGCLLVTSGAGSFACAMAGAALSLALEFVITAYGPQIFDAVFNALVVVAVGLIDAANVIAWAVTGAVDAVETAFNDAGGAIVSGFNDAGAAISSGFIAFGDTLSQAGETASQWAAEVAAAFGFGFEETTAAILGFGYDLQGAFEAAWNVFELGSGEAVRAMLFAVAAVGVQVMHAIEGVYDLAAGLAADALREAGYAVDVIVAGLTSVYDLTVAGIVSVLDDIGYGVNQMVSAITNVLDTVAEEMAGVLKTLEYTVQQIGESLQQIYELVDVAAAQVLAAVEFAVGEVATALKDVYREAAALAASVLKEAGYLIDEVTTGLKDAYEATAAQVTQILKAIEYTAEQVAGALVEVYDQVAEGVATLLTGAGYIVDEIASAVSNVFDMAAEGVASLLRTVGYAIEDITHVLSSVFNKLDAEVASILKAMQYGINEISAALQSVLDVTAAAITTLLKDLGYAIDEIAGVLESVYNEVASAAAALLEAAGYTFSQIGGALESVFDQAGEAVASILKDIGATAAEINTVLTDTFNYTVDQIGGLLSSIGFSSDTIAAIGGAFEDFGEDVAGWFEDAFG